MQLTPELIKESVRYDPEIKAFSVIDVVSLVTGQSKHMAATTFRRVKAEYFNDDHNIIKIQYPGNSRETPFAHFHVICHIINLLPGPTAREFTKKAMVTFARALGGDLTLANEIQTVAARLDGTELQEAILEDTQGPDNLLPTLRDRVPRMGIEYQRWLLDKLAPNPDWQELELLEPMKMHDFLDEFCERANDAYIPLDVFENLLRYVEMTRFHQKRCLLNSTSKKDMRFTHKVEFVKDRRLWQGTYRNCDYIVGLRFKDHDQAVRDAEEARLFILECKRVFSLTV